MTNRELIENLKQQVATLKSKLRDANNELLSWTPLSELPMDGREVLLACPVETLDGDIGTMDVMCCYDAHECAWVDRDGAHLSEFCDHQDYVFGFDVGRPPKVPKHRSELLPSTAEQDDMTVSKEWLELIQIDHDTYELVDRQKTPRLTGSQERELINQELTELYGTNQPWR